MTAMDIVFDDFEFEFEGGDTFVAELTQGGVVRASFLGGSSWAEPLSDFISHARREAEIWAGNNEEARRFARALNDWIATID